MKVAPSVAIDKCIAVFSWNCAQTLPNYEDSTPVGETGRMATKVEVGFSHYLTLNWINVNKLRFWLTLNFLC